MSEKELEKIIRAVQSVQSESNTGEPSCQDDGSKCGLDVLLDYCTILYQPENYNYYAVPDGKGSAGTIGLPKDYSELMERCRECCSMMQECLSEQEEYLKYPQFDEMEQHISQLRLEECMQFFLFYNRLPLKYGQRYFFEKWKDGTALRIVKRMQQLRKNG